MESRPFGTAIRASGLSTWQPAELGSGPQTSRQLLSGPLTTWSDSTRPAGGSHQTATAPCPSNSCLHPMHGDQSHFQPLEAFGFSYHLL